MRTPKPLGDSRGPVSLSTLMKFPCIQRRGVLIDVVEGTVKDFTSTWSDGVLK